MNSNNYSVSVVIPVYNEEKILRRQVQQIIKGLRSKPKTNYEIVLVANGCTDNTFRICKDLNRRKGVRTIFLEKADYGYALREGMRAAIGKVIVNLI